MMMPTVQLHLIRHIFTKIVKKNVHPLMKKIIEDDLSLIMTGLTTTITKWTNSTFLETQIGNVPKFKDVGITFDLDLLLKKNIYLLEKRFLGSSSQGPPAPSAGTELQTWLSSDSASSTTESIIQILTPYFKKVNLINFNDNSSDIRFGDFLIKEKVNWGKDSKLLYEDGLIILDLVLSFTGSSNYFSNETSDGLFIGSVGKFKISTNITFTSENDILISNIVAQTGRMDSMTVYFSSETLGLIGI